MNPIILLHGALGASSQMEPLKNLLINQYEVYAFDLPGHGKSVVDKPFSMDLFADVLQEFIDFNNIKSPDIFGFSMGGYVAYSHALKFPGITNKIISLGTKLKWTPEEAVKEIKMINPSKIEEKVPKFANYLSSLHINWKENMLKTAALMSDLGNGEALSERDFQSISNETFFGIGELDEMVTREETIRFSQAVKKSTFFELKETKHPIQQVDPDLLANKIIEIIKT